MAWWQWRRRPGPRDDGGHRVPTQALMIQPGTIQIAGMDLERAVQREVIGDLDWELYNMQPLLIALTTLHFVVSLHTCRSGWCCDVQKGGILRPDSEECVREFGNESPATALARAALAAVRQWPN